MEADSIHSLGDYRIAIILTGIGSAAVVIAIYHCISVGWCNRHHPNPSPPNPTTFMPQIVELPASIENSTAQLIPAHKYHKGMGLVSDDGLCAVCLCEFAEGEEIRTLPECLHTYHAPCIDMWLYSHSNCPMCRTDAVPSLQIIQPPDIGPRELEPGMLQNTVLQSRTTISV